MSDPILSLTEDHKEALIKVAQDSIAYGLENNRPMPVEPKDFPVELQIPRAVFVTLFLDEALQGCIGTLDSGQPLVANIARYAYSSAFLDSRFSPVQRDDIPRLKIHISILSPLETMTFQSESDLLAQIRPGIDGLLLEDDYHRGTLLPSVWEDIPEPQEFWRRLKMKAGLSPNHWSDSLQVKRYTAVSIGH